jgi:SPP1 gp7 family putative phage head morphogenesis protein
MANNYWANRTAKAQSVLFDKNRKQIERQLRRHYKNLALQVMDDYESTYNKLIATMEEGRQPTPADLYNLDRYWQMQGRLRDNLRKLNERQVKMLTKHFERTFLDTYQELAIESLQTYSTIDENAVQQVINQIWCSDGKSWSQRIWQNTKLLQETLNDGLVQCVAAGKPSSFLKQTLQERFSVSFNNADMLVRTELAHIQTQAAKQRYTDCGIAQVEILADKDERRCEVCGKLHGKRYPVGAAVPIPAHPRCRCCIVPVIDD